MIYDLLILVEFLKYFRFIENWDRFFFYFFFGGGRVERKSINSLCKVI